jgi:hypothetical protein
MSRFLQSIIKQINHNHRLEWLRHWQSLWSADSEEYHCRLQEAGQLQNFTEEEKGCQKLMKAKAGLHSGCFSQALLPFIVILQKASGQTGLLKGVVNVALIFLQVLK